MKLENLTTKFSGIYAIKNTVTGAIRVGSSRDIHKRFSNYKSLLNNNKYNNKAMQEDWNEYGKDNFEFIILECCGVKDLFVREKFWMEQFGDKCIYNTNKIKNTKKKIIKGKKREEIHNRKSVAQAGENNPRCKMTKEIAGQILWLREHTNLTNVQIALYFNNIVNKNMVSRIGKDRWKDVEEIIPEEFIKFVA